MTRQEFKTTRLIKLAIITIIALGAACLITGVKAEATPVNAQDTSIPEAGIQVINYDPVWGDVDANRQKMTKITKQCVNDGGEMIIFPAMSLTGYMSKEDSDKAVKVAQTRTSTAVKKLANLADEKNIWLIFGTIEKKNGKIYNSAFACSPAGKIKTYKEINPTNSMFARGTKPVTITTKWGNVGLMVGNDAVNTPEIIRYYSACDTAPSTKLADAGMCGCGIVACCLDYNENYNYSANNYNKTEWTLINRFSTLCSQNGLMIAAANLSGRDKEEQFPGGSCIFADQLFGGTDRLYAGGQGEQQKTGEYTYSLDMGRDEIDTVKKLQDKELYGMKIMESGFFLELAPSSACTTSNDFAPDRYARQYKKLADKQKAGGNFNYRVTESTDIKVAMANTNTPEWGNKKAAIENMKKYIIQAGKAGSDIIVFPETVLTGYTYIRDYYDYSDYNPLTKEVIAGKKGVEMHVGLAETVPGPTTEYLKKYAKKYNMYIVFGLAEKPDSTVYEGGVEKVYNSMAVIAPDGKTTSYQKEHRAGVEDQWSLCGERPVICKMTFDGVTVKAGLMICRDGHFYPELARYMTGSGAQLLIHPVATSGDCAYREGHIGAYAQRDNVTVISVNLWGFDGVKGKISDTFGSTSLTASPKNSISLKDEKPINLYGTGEKAVSPEGLEYAEHVNLRGSGTKVGNLKYDTLARMYDALACRMIDGYKTLYPDTPKPVKISRAAISKAVAGKSKITVKMKKKASAYGGSAFQIRYRKAGSTKWKTVKTTAQSKVISKLKKGKRYYVKARACRKVNGKYRYGDWSRTVKTAKIK